MKRILTTMCALTLLLAASVPALAAEPEQSASYYPTSVEEYMEGDSPRIKKVYQLSLADDPSQIPTEDFERDGRLYYLLDMTRKDEVGVDIQTITQTKTLASETNNMEKILQSLEPQMEVTTEDGYTGTLTLDHTTVKVAADGYAIKFIVTACEPFGLWAFTMENGNLSGSWKGVFEAVADGGTRLHCTETVNAKRWWMRPFVPGYLKRQQKRYLDDLRKELLK